MIIEIKQEYDLIDWAYSTILMGVLCTIFNLVFLELGEKYPSLYIASGWIMACYVHQMLKLTYIWAHSKVQNKS